MKENLKHIKAFSIIALLDRSTLMLCKSCSWILLKNLVSLPYMRKDTHADDKSPHKKIRYEPTPLTCLGIRDVINISDTITDNDTQTNITIMPIGMTIMKP